MDIIEYIRPELIVVSIVLYFVGTIFKKSERVNDRDIPIILATIGIGICTLWIFGTSNGTHMALKIFASVTQGVLVAGFSTFVDQLIKQYFPKEETIKEPIANIIQDKLQSVLTNLELNNNATKSTIKHSIIRAYNEALYYGSVTEEEYQSLCDLYVEYKNLGGNGYIEDIMSEINKIQRGDKNERK